MGHRRRRVGGALPQWLQEVGSFLKKHQVISRGANALSGILPPGWSQAASAVGKASGAIGYGRRKGRGLRAGGSAGLTMAGVRLY